MAEFTTVERQLIRELVEYYKDNSDTLRTFLESFVGQVQASKTLKPYIHSLKARMKDPDHLEDKLKRKFREYKKKDKNFPITTKNLFVKINDLAGLRILHLYTQQIDPI